MSNVSSWHIGVAAEAIVAAQFARFGYYVSVQYGANQPEYDLMAERDGEILKISVKGSQDGGWGLTQKYKKGISYHQAAQLWLDSHHKKTIFCLVQFENVDDTQMPRMYLATPEEIKDQLCAQANGRGDTILYENHRWGLRALAAGTIDQLPENWIFTKERVEYMFHTYGK